jgi:GNAT superfamily N-acetyltransferase
MSQRTLGGQFPELPEFGITKVRTAKRATQTYGTRDVLPRMVGSDMREPGEFTDNEVSRGDPFKVTGSYRVPLRGRFIPPPRPLSDTEWASLDKIEGSGRASALHERLSQPPSTGMQGVLFPERFRMGSSPVPAHLRPEYRSLEEAPSFFPDDDEYSYNPSDGDVPGVKSHEVPAPNLEADYTTRNGDKYTLTEHHLTHGRRMIHAWHEGETVGQLKVGRELRYAEDTSAYDEYGDDARSGWLEGETHPTPALMSVNPRHQRRGLARALFRFAQLTGQHEDPQKNLIHSSDRTEDGYAYSAEVPDDPRKDPGRRIGFKTSPIQGTLDIPPR